MPVIQQDNDFVNNIFKWIAFGERLADRVKAKDENERLALKLASAIKGLVDSGIIDENKAQVLLNSDPQTVAKVLPKFVAIPKKAIQGKDKAYIVDPLTGKVEAEFNLTDPRTREAYARYLSEKAKTIGNVIVEDKKSNKILMIDKNFNVKEYKYEPTNDFEMEAKHQILNGGRGSNSTHKRFDLIYRDKDFPQFQILYDRETGKFTALQPVLVPDEHGDPRFDHLRIIEIDKKDFDKINPLIYDLKNKQLDPKQKMGLLDNILNFVGKSITAIPSIFDDLKSFITHGDNENINQQITTQFDNDMNVNTQFNPNSLEDIYTP